MAGFSSFIEKTVKVVGSVSKVGVEIGADLLGIIVEKIDDNPEAKEKFSNYGKNIGQTIKNYTDDIAITSAKFTDNLGEYGTKVYQSVNNNIKELNVGRSETNKVTIQCPYCNSSIFITSEGQWSCPDCNNNFRYLNSEIEKSEDVCTEAVICLVALLAKISKADGAVTAREISIFKDILKNETELNNKQMQEAAAIFNTEKANIYNYEEYLKRAYVSLSDNKNLLKYFIEIMFKVANEDGGVHSEQEKIILRAVYIFELSNYEYEEIRNRLIQELDKYYEILKCSRDSTNEEITSTYRKLIITYHPDKYISKDLPQEMINLAKEKTQEIQNAYDLIRKARGA